MDISIYFNDERCFVTIKVDDESRDDLLPPKMDSQLVRPQFLPNVSRLFGGRHFAAEFFCALEFFFGDALTRDDVFDEHEVILIQNQPPKGEELRPLRTKPVWLWKITQRIR